MTTEELDGIEVALSPLVVRDSCSAPAKSAARLFNEQVSRERRRLEGTRSGDGEACAISSTLEVELRASALMFAAERERIARRWNIPLSAPPDPPVA